MVRVGLRDIVTAAGTAAVMRVGADLLWTRCGEGDDGPLGFYLRHGFVQAGDVSWDDDDPEHLFRLDLSAAAPKEDR